MVATNADQLNLMRATAASEGCAGPARTDAGAVPGAAQGAAHGQAGNKRDFFRQFFIASGRSAIYTSQ